MISSYFKLLSNALLLKLDVRGQAALLMSQSYILKYADQVKFCETKPLFLLNFDSFVQ